MAIADKVHHTSGGYASFGPFRKGLDIPISGEPEQRIHDAEPVSAVAVTGTDYLGLKPRMEINEGDTVKLGDVLFTDKRHEGVVFTAPAAGRVRAINRGAKRVLESVVIDVDADGGAIDFGAADADTLDRDAVIDKLCRSGMWPVIRTRPFSKIPDPKSTTHAIFITAMDTTPLAPDVDIVVGDNDEDFERGVEALAKLTDGKVYVCHGPGARIPHVIGERIVYANFSGPHPAGNAGTHIHFLEPIDAHHFVWTVHYQDVMAIGELLRTGRLPTQRVIALAGPQAKQPRLLRTRVGADLVQLCEGEISDDTLETRLISGDVLTGRTVDGSQIYLGRYHRHVCLMREGREREFLGWLIPSFEKFATARVHMRTLLQKKARLPLSTSMQGSARAMVPIGLFEDLMPQDYLPTQLLRALLVLDTDAAQDMGALELDEEDVALATYVCPGKYEYGMALRDNLDKIEAEG